MSKKRTNIDYSKLSEYELKTKIELFEETIKECSEAILMAKVAADDLVGANEGRVGKMFTYDESDTDEEGDPIVKHRHVFVHKRVKPERATGYQYNFQPDTYLVTRVTLITDTTTSDIKSAYIHTNKSIPLVDLADSHEIEPYEFESILDQAVSIIKGKLN